MPAANAPKTKARTLPREGGRGHARALDRPKIIAAARELAHARGAGGLTMRGIARHLGVDPAALYWHFAGKAELLDAIARDAVDEHTIELEGDGPWQDRARSLCHALAERLRGDPALQVMGRSDASLGPFYASATGAAGRLLAEAGLEGEDLVFAAHTLVHTVTAVLSAQAAQDGAGLESVRRYTRGVADTLPRAESERWVDVARRDPTHSFDAWLDHAIEIVITGIEARAAGTT